MTVFEPEKLRRHLMAVVYTEAILKLQIFQRGLRLNASVPVYDRRPTTVAARGGAAKRPHLKRKQRSNDNAHDEPLRGTLSEKVLNEIKLQRELDTLIGSYKLAQELLTAAPSRDKDEAEQPGEQATVAFGNAVAALQADDNGEERLERELRHNQAHLKALKVQLQSEREAANERMARQVERCTLLLTNLHNVRRLNELEVSLVQRWEENRQTQAAIVGENAERHLLRQVLDLRRRSGAEQRIICELQSFQAKQLADLQEKIVHWQQRYSIEMEKKLRQLGRQADRQRILAKQRERHSETYAQRVEYVRIYLEHAAEEQRQLALEAHRIASAVLIQAWWRGTMVRRGLGPYKKKSKKGKKGRGGGKAAK